LGLELYLIFVPFAGAVQLWLYPAAWAVLIKDILFALPAYIGFVLSGELPRTLPQIPRALGLLVTLFVGLVLVQALNPLGPGLYATLIGLKVWLFYLPMILLGRAYVQTRSNLMRMSRIMLGLAWLPCAIGILQWLLSKKYGYDYAIGLFYGNEAGKNATQGFTQFDNGLIRIPATFAFPTQYLNYILCMFVPVLGCITTELHGTWRKVCMADLVLLCVAGFMTGLRSAFLMIPLMMFSFYLIRRGLMGAVWASLLMASLLGAFISISGIDSGGLLQMETDLSHVYAVGQTGVMSDALRLTWIGRGVGTSTGAARLAVDNPDDFVGFESFYAKTVAELGLIGLALILLLQFLLLMLTVRILRSAADSVTATYVCAIAACLLVFLVYNYKGVVIDLDPANMLYWLFVGVLLALPTLDAKGSQENMSMASAQRGTYAY
jgi:hypothetical protein